LLTALAASVVLSSEAKFLLSLVCIKILYYAST
jgi:hypothetical protein